MAVVVPSLPTLVATTEAYSFADGFPRSWLCAVLQAFPGNGSVPKLICLHFEALRQRLINPQNYTMRDLFHARDVLGVKLTDSALRNSMKLPRRWVVERTFAWLSHCRRLSKDYEYYPQTSEALVYVAMIRLMARRLARSP